MTWQWDVKMRLCRLQFYVLLCISCAASTKYDSLLLSSLPPRKAAITVSSQLARLLQRCLLEPEGQMSTTVMETTEVTQEELQARKCG